MRIGPGLHRLLGGDGALASADPLDCAVYAVETSAGTLVFDAGGGRDPAAFGAKLDGLPQPVMGFLTHAHADHSAGAWVLAARGVPLLAGAATKRMVESGDERAMSLDVARTVGIYPADFRYTSCRIDRVLADDAIVEIGDTTVRAIATPGHSHDHVAYLVIRPSDSFLVVGDALFAGGRVVLQDIWDCSVSDTCKTVRRLGSLNFQGFLPGHGPFSLAEGEKHVATALTRVNRLLPPELFL